MLLEILTNQILLSIWDSSNTLASVGETNIKGSVEKGDNHFGQQTIFIIKQIFKAEV